MPNSSRFTTFLHLVRALFPRWSFFDRVGDDVALEVCTRQNGTWLRISFACHQKPLSLLVNPEVSLALAQQSLVEQFAQETTDCADVKTLTSYKMIVSLIELQVKEEFQFRLSARSGSVSANASASPASAKPVAVYTSAWIGGAP